jgi:hypothetical protein
MTFSPSFYCIETDRRIKSSLSFYLGCKNETIKMKKALKNQGFSATAFAGPFL